MIDDSSLEFDLFEDVRRKLTELLVGEGYAQLEAERISLYVIQGIRGVPKLLAALTEAVPHSTSLNALHAVLENADALTKARSLLLRLNTEDTNPR